jgi:hypothetical protein
VAFDLFSAMAALADIAAAIPRHFPTDRLMPVKQASGS